MKRFTILGSLVILGLLACDNPQAPEAWQPDFLPVSGAVANDPTGDANITPGNNGSYVYNSTNAFNEAMQTPGRVGQAAPHVIFSSVGVEQVTLTLKNPSAVLACFEWRIDGQVAYSENPPVDHYLLSSFGSDEKVYPFQCIGVGGADVSKTFDATSTVDVRQAFGPEQDFMFDWTRFYVLSLENKDQCRSGDWEALGFKNQGQCVRYVETGKDSRTGG